MEIIILKDYESICKYAARKIVSLINRKPDAVLGLATGRTMVGVYKELVEAFNRGEVDFSLVTTFNLDEYLGILPNAPESFRYFMEEHLFKHINIPRENIHIPYSLTTSPTLESKKYEEEIKKAGNIDLQLLGIGGNGHIGFNEPTSSFQSRTRIKTLTEKTLKDNFPDGNGPKFAITMGLGTIMEAKEILLLASGEYKANAIAKAIEGPVSSSVPASILQHHPRVAFIVDEDAGKLLKNKKYYSWVWKNKERAESGHVYKKGLVKIETPSRICLFGEHQDYLNMPVISAGINLTMDLTAERLSEKKVDFYLADFNTSKKFDLNFPLQYDEERDYIKSAFNVLKREGVNIDWGVRASVSSNIPINAGASSSSALVISIIKLILELAGDKRKDSPKDIAEFGYKVEVAEFNEPGGKMDHYSCAYGGVLYLDFSENLVEQLPVELSGFVLGHSLQPKDTKGTLRRAKEAQIEAIQKLKEMKPDFDLKKNSYEEMKSYIEKLPEELKPYGEAALMNRDLTIKAKALLKSGNFSNEELGKLLYEHHAVLRDKLKLSTKTIDRMLSEAMKVGALGGKINGSGGGGTMFVFAPGKEEWVKEAFEKMGKPAYILKIVKGTRAYYY